MHLTRPRMPIVLCGMIAAASVASAEPLDLGRVPAGAVWLMHADMDAAREATVVSRMVERAMKKHPQLEGMLAMGAKMTGMDIRRDLHDVTVYGLDTDKRNAVMIVRADANREFLEKMVAKARDHETMEHRGYTLHAWTHRGWKGRGEAKVVGAFFKDDVMIFACSADRVEKALDVLDGKAAVAGGDSPLAGRTRPGSILVGRAAKVDPDTKCPVLRQGEGFRVALGESEGRSFYRARLDMESPEAARLAEEVARGLSATIALGAGEIQGVTKLAERLETATEGKACMISWEAAADDVWQVAEAMAEKLEARMAAHRRQWGGGRQPCGDCDRDDCRGCGKRRCPLDADADGAGRRADDARRPFRDDEF